LLFIIFDCSVNFEKEKIMGLALLLYPKLLEILQKEQNALYDLVKVSFRACLLIFDLDFKTMYFILTNL